MVADTVGKEGSAMNKFTAGMIGMMLGGLAGIAGMEYLKSSQSAKNQLMRSGKKAAAKAADVIEEAADHLR